MKKVLSIVLVCLICISLSACGATETSSNTTSTPSEFQTDNVKDNSSITSSTTVSSSSSSSQGLATYKLPTPDELIESFETLFTISDIRREDDSVGFKTSKGELIIGNVNGSGEISKFWVSASGNDANTLLTTPHHYYPVCHYLSIITGENVKDGDLLDIILSVEPKRKSTDYSVTTTWSVKKNGIEYQLSVSEFSSNYIQTCSIDITVKIY
jgi:hypothetical protein